MLFGLTNAPAAFQRFMNDVFSNLLDMCIVVYLDDILIYSDDIRQHWSHVKEVLKRLQKAELYAKAEKCEFHLDSIEYLGYVLSLSGLTMSDAKVKTIQEWLEPKKVKDIQSFLCHDLVKRLSQYLYFFSFLFFYLGLTTQKGVWESIMSQCHSVTSHDVTW